MSSFPSSHTCTHSLDQIKMTDSLTRTTYGIFLIRDFFFAWGTELVLSFSVFMSRRSVRVCSFTIHSNQSTLCTQVNYSSDAEFNTPPPTLHNFLRTFANALMNMSNKIFWMKWCPLECEIHQHKLQSAAEVTTEKPRLLVWNGFAFFFRKEYWGEKEVWVSVWYRSTHCQ